MEEQLRRSAGFWRGVAGVTMVLGIVGSIIIAVVVARGPYGDEFDAGAFFTILIPSILGLMLTLGFFFIATRMMDGMAELLDRTPTRGADKGRRLSEPTTGQAHSQRSKEWLDEDRLVTPLQVEVGRMRQVGLARGQLIAVSALSDTEAIVDTGSGRFRLTVGDNGRAKVEEAESSQPASSPLVAATIWTPDRQVPPGGMAAWPRPDATLAPATRLAERVQLRVDETRGAWAKVTGSNGWVGWVDSRLLLPLVEPEPPLEPAPPEPAGS